MPGGAVTERFWEPQLQRDLGSSVIIVPCMHRSSGLAFLKQFALSSRGDLRLALLP